MDSRYKVYLDKIEKAKSNGELVDVLKALPDEKKNKALTETEVSKLLAAMGERFEEM